MKRLVLVAFLVFAGCSNDAPFERASVHTPPYEPSPNLTRPTTTTSSTIAAPRRVPPVASRSASRPRPTVPPTVGAGDLLDRLAQCESHGNPRAISANHRYFGAWQFLLSTWHNLGGTGNPIDHTYAEQRAVAALIPVASWRTQFPVCSRRLGV